MKLEEKFFKVFFYQFLVSILLCTITVSLILYFFTNNNIDKKTKDFIINLSKKNVRNIINIAKILIKTKIQKYQSGLNEQILFYQKIARELLESNKDDLKFNDYYLKNLLTLDITHYCYYIYEQTKTKAFWYVDEFTTENDLDDKLELKLQLIAFSNIIQIWIQMLKQLNLIHMFIILILKKMNYIYLILFLMDMIIIIFIIIQILFIMVQHV